MNPYESPRLPLATAIDVHAPPVELPPGAVPFRGAVSVAEALEADRTLLPWQMTGFWFSIVVFSLGGALMLLLGIGLLPGSGFSPLLVVALFFFFLVAVVVGQRWRLLRKAHRLQRNGNGINGQLSGYVGPGEYFTSRDGSWSVVRWHAFRGFHRSPRVMILYWLRAPGFLLITRGHFASEADWQQAAAIVGEQVAKL
jgi:hypothetical protein